MHAMRRLFLAFLFVALPLASAMLAAQGTPPRRTPAPATASQSGMDLSSLDRSANPCTDFFQFACGGWLGNNPIPGDQPRWGRFDELQERNNEVLHKVLESASAGTDPASKRIGDYYATCMDEDAIERKGITPLEPDLQKIAALKSVGDLPALVAGLHTIGVNAFFTFGAEGDFKNASMVIAQLDQGGLGMPDRDYYFKADSRSADLRGQYVDHVGTLVGLSGRKDRPSAATAASVMKFETGLAKSALDNVARRDPARVYHKITVTELQALTPAFNWQAYFRGTGAPSFTEINVAEPEFLKAFNQLLESTPLEDIKSYLTWHLVHANAFLLAKAFVAENFKFYSTTLRGVSEQRIRWKRCVQYTDADLGEALGQAFVSATFGPRAKADMLTMVAGVEAALRDDISKLTWMTDTTKQQAYAKLKQVSNKIGYPDKWRDYSALTIVRGDAIGNSHRANTFEFHRQLNKIGKPLDKTEWSMTPPTVNAYYNPLENNINFPAGILQTPFYSASTDAALNYGGAGAVIGHELTHGFDDQGRQFDGDGNLHDWWTEADGKAFDERAACFVDQYANYSPIDEVKLNGKLTLGENTADNGGLRIALMAYLASAAAKEAKTLDGFTPEQRVFLGWGQVWCESRRPEYERLLAQTNPHSPAKFRVNGVVSNMPEFQKAFSCNGNAPMVRAKACRVW